MKRVVILGGGVGGTVAANVLARRAKDADITVVDRTGRHVYQPGFVYVAFGRQDPARLAKDERRLLRRRVKLVVDEVERVDTASKEVRLASGRSLPYDYLVIATGAELALDAIPGSEAAQHFWSLEGALRLRKALAVFRGGRIVIAIGGMPYKCPPAPSEAACLLDYYYTKRGLRDRVDILFLSPLGRVFPIESVSPAVQSLFDAKHVRYTMFFNVERIDPATKTVYSLEGEAVPYDLLILVPPHRGVRFAKESGLTDAGGWITTDRHTLQVKGHEGSIWALGDATDIPISKSGAAAHYEAKVIAENIAATLRAEGPQARYEGKVMCLFDAGFRRAFALRFDFSHPPPAPLPTRRWYVGKMLLNRFYWNLVPKARA